MKVGIVEKVYFTAEVEMITNIITKALICIEHLDNIISRAADLSRPGHISAIRIKIEYESSS